MSATSDTRLVPAMFEQYLLTKQARRVRGNSTKCDGCFREDLRCWLLPDGNPSIMCEACLRQFHGSDTEEERMVRAIVGAAVAAALEMGASEDLVRAAVDDAFSQRVRVEVG